MDPYVYRPLDLTQDSFRLIRLVMGTGPPIQCELIHALLQDEGSFMEYHALSYTWGKKTKTRSVEIETRILPVTENLYHALKHLRFPHEDRILWIDAISIDQDNLMERGHQVRQMGDIYRGATQVDIWLGLPTPPVDVVLRNMQQFEIEARAYACNDWQPSDERWHKLWRSTLALYGEYDENFEEQRRSGMLDLLGRPWFERVWIIQEVAHARVASIMCGNLKVSSRIFAITPLLLHLEPTPLCQAIMDIMPGPSRRYSWWSSTRDLRTLISRFSNSRASDPRDKIYALLGLSDAYSNYSLMPDYTKSMEEVVHSLLACLLDLKPEESLTGTLPSWSLERIVSEINEGTLNCGVFAWAAVMEERPVAEKLLRHESKLEESEGQTIMDAAVAAEHNWILQLNSWDWSKYLDPHERHKALAGAIQNHRPEWMNGLLLKGADPFHQRQQNLKSIERDLEGRDWAVINRLLDREYYGAEPKLRSVDGEYWKIGAGIILAIGADRAWGKRYDLQPYSESYERIYDQLLDEMLENVLHQGKSGETALWISSSIGYCEVVRWLLAHGTDATAVGPAGETPLEAATRGNYQRVIALLEQGWFTNGDWLANADWLANDDWLPNAV